MTYIVQFLSIFIPLIIIDFVWLGVIAKGFYLKELGQLARLGVDGSFNFNLPSGIIVYILMTLGIIFFVLPKVTTFENALLWGFVFGVIIYGIYDFTNFAALSGWSLKLMIVDIVWGGFLSAIVTYLSFFIKKIF